MKRGIVVRADQEVRGVVAETSAQVVSGAACSVVFRFLSARHQALFNLSVAVDDQGRAGACRNPPEPAVQLGATPARPRRALCRQQDLVRALAS